MEGHIVELYSEADMQRLRRRVKGWRIALCSIGLAALAVCIVLAALTRTANAVKMELAVIIISTVAGWLIIYFGIFAVAAGRHELDHADMLGKEERTKIAGTFAVTDQRIVIKRSITARRVEVQGDGETHRLLVCESRAGVLEKAEVLALYTVHGYVAAYEAAQ